MTKSAALPKTGEAAAPSLLATLGTAILSLFGLLGLSHKHREDD
jgi:LPXTG-motif cell wall-anchored protein